METKPQSQRILALDLLRGYFLCVVLVDHIYRFPGFFDIFSGQGKLWVSAAEGFFLISGVLVGFIYREAVKTHFWAVATKLWKRAATLYFWAVALTLFFTIWANLTPSLKIKQNWLSLSDPLRLLIDTLSLRYTYGWADFLPYYAIFMLFAPLALWLLAKRRWWLVILATSGVWLLRQDNFYLSWQLLFTFGITGGYYLLQLEKKLRPTYVTWLYTLSLLTLFLSVVMVFGVKALLDLNWHLDFLSQANLSALKDLSYWHKELLVSVFDKGKLGPGRALLALLWFSALYYWVRRHEQKINAWSKGFFKTFGANSLLAYGLHALLIFPINLILPSYTPLWQNILINAGLLGLLYALVVLITYLTKK